MRGEASAQAGACRSLSGASGDPPGLEMPEGISQIVERGAAAKDSRHAESRASLRRQCADWLAGVRAEWARAAKKVRCGVVI